MIIVGKLKSFIIEVMPTTLSYIIDILNFRYKSLDIAGTLVKNRNLSKKYVSYGLHRKVLSLPQSINCNLLRIIIV